MTVETYLHWVGYELRDLPWGMRRRLLEELAEHLSEVPAGTDLVARLGRPEEYAAEMRAAAGLEHRRGPIAFVRARRPRNLILFVLALTVAGLAIGAVVWIDSYQPIVYGNATQMPLDSTPSPGQPGVTVVFRKGRPFLYGVTIRNSGRFTVRILGVPSDVMDFFKGRLLMNKPNPAGNELPLERFRPFDLHSGEARWLVWKGVYACTTGAGRDLGVTREAIPVRFSFLWRTETTFVPAQDPLRITFPKGCPSPSR